MNIRELEQVVAKKLGFKFNLPADLSPADREILYDEEARYIAANPSLFGENWIEWSKKRMGGSFYNVPLENYSLGDAVQTFTEEFANQAVQINDALNPFSEANRKIVFWLAVLGVGAYFLAPVIVQAIAASKNAKASPSPVK